MKGRTRKAALVIGVLTVIIGLGIILYPFVSEWINHGRYEHIAKEYSQEVEQTDESVSQEILEAARNYNLELYRRSGGGIMNLTEDQMTEYEAQLAMSATTIMGYIEIPKIGQILPIYHGTSEDVLQAGAGHLEGSSLPVGGESSHCVITGHSGLPGKKIFTDLDRMKEGDRFTISILNEDLVYEVDGIRVELPEDVKLNIPEHGDEVTLITCTPVGANTHRLLVHAHRVQSTEPSGPLSHEDEGPGNSYLGLSIVIVLSIIVIVSGVCLIVCLKKRRRERK